MEIKFLNTLLHILLLMIKLGFYRKIEKINLIIKRLIQLLQKKLRLVQKKQEGAIGKTNPNFSQSGSHLQGTSAQEQGSTAGECEVEGLPDNLGHPHDPERDQDQLPSLQIEDRLDALLPQQLVEYRTLERGSAYSLGLPRQGPSRAGK